MTRVVASHDDDPAWIFSEVEELDATPIAYRELELLPEMPDRVFVQLDQARSTRHSAPR